MKPATPRTSSTETVVATMPGSIIVASDAGWFGAVTFPPTIGSLRTNGTSTIRFPSFKTWSTFVNAPSGTVLEFQGISVRLSAVSVAPNGNVSFATTTVEDDTTATADGWIASQDHATNADASPMRLATSKIKILVP